MTVRIDNYIAPALWNDLEMDWTDPDPTDCKYVHALILAIKERLTGPSSYGYPVSLPVISPDIRMKHSTLMAIHNWTFALWKGNLDDQIRYLNCDEPVVNRTITKTADGACYTGTYDYHLCDLNYWNDASIIEAIGDDAIVWPQPDMCDNKPWLIQQYKILNKLNTHVVLLVPYSVYGKKRSYEIQYGTVVRDETTDWILNPDNRNAYKSASLVDPMHGSGYVWEFHKSQAIKHVWSCPIPFKYNVDIIGFITRYLGTDWLFSSEAFSGISAIGYWFEEFPFSIQKDTIPLVAYEVGDISLLPLPPLTDRYKSSVQSYGWGSERQTFDSYYGFPKPIGKFNFNFQD